MPVQKGKNSKLLFLLSLLAAVGILSLISNSMEVFDSYENQTIDYRFQLTVNNEQIDTNFVFIAIDQLSLDLFDDELKIGWPWPREVYGILLNYISEARAVILDIDFSNNLNITQYDDGYSDAQFVVALNQAENEYLICVLGKNKRKKISSKDAEEYFNPVESTKSYHKFESIVLPLKKFRDADTEIGAANFMTDSDGTVRKYHSSFNYRELLVPTISAKVFEKFFEDKSSLPDQHLINWYGAGGPEGSFEYFSFHSILSSAIAKEQEKQVKIPKRNFKDKIVFVGGTANGLLDNYSTPMSAFGAYPGMEIHATALKNYINNDYKILVPRLLSLLTIIAIVAFPVVMILYSKINALKFLSPFVVTIVFLLVNLFVFWSYNYVIPVVLPLFMLVNSTIATAVFAYVIEGRKRIKLKQLFSRYVSPIAIEEVINQSEQLGLAGKEIEATVFFSDIKGFTSISESLEPRQLVEYLNEYFSCASKIVLDHKAMLDKYIGDAIMAIFGAPLRIENHAYLACSAALTMQKELKNLYQNSSNGKPKFETRIGINTGKMIMGNIGTEIRSDYTAIGDTVNLSSRLEGMNKTFGTDILVSEKTKMLANDFFHFRLLDKIAVKGKNEPVEVFELVCNKNELSNDVNEFIEIFEEGLKNYRLQKWSDALKLFARAHRIKELDVSCELYRNRCENFLINPPGEEWDGVFYAKTK